MARGDIRSGGFDLNGLWSPWYVLHKMYAGLRDAYRYTGNRTALEMEIKFAAWAEGVLAKLNDAQIQQMLGTEFGGMNEVLADLYADTGDRRWLALSDRFQHRAIVDPLARREDILAGKHGNTQVPKLFGSLVRYLADGQRGRRHGCPVLLGPGGRAPQLCHRRPRQGRVLRPARQAQRPHRRPHRRDLQRLQHAQDDAAALRPAARHPLCGVPRAGACSTTSSARSIRRTDGPATWCPWGEASRASTQDMFDGGFTCCVGTGMESHALHGDGIYYEAGDRLWVNLYVPSTAEWKSAGVKLAMETDFPEGESATLKLTLHSPQATDAGLASPFLGRRGFRRQGQWPVGCTICPSPVPTSS